MTPLLILLFVDIPGIQTDIDANTPNRVKAYLHTNVWCQSGIIEDIISKGNLMLSISELTCKNAQDRKR